MRWELAACFSRAEEIGIRSAGILIVSDNKTSSLGDKDSKKRKYLAKIAAVKNVIEHIEEFALSELPSDFSINKYLADVIHNPEDDKNVYREP